jgi:hydroxyacylglutathione hydrolase
MLPVNTAMITTVDLKGVNCYLLKSGADPGSFVLIDTGFASRRALIDEALQKAGCRPGDLKLIIITHGDSDHTGNAVYLRRKYGALIALHRGDLAMVEQGDMLANRKANFLVRALFGLVKLTPWALRKTDRFIPDIFLDESPDLLPFGLDAKIIHLPGHSAGSVGILTAQGDLFCGDLFMNKNGQPIFSSFYIDRKLGLVSLQKLKALNIKTIYPGHGEPFARPKLDTLR